MLLATLFVLMTALVASLGFVLMALATEAGAELERALTSLVIRGIPRSTFLALVLLPLLYDWLERDAPNSERLARISSGEGSTPASLHDVEHRPRGEHDRSD